MRSSRILSGALLNLSTAICRASVTAALCTMMAVSPALAEGLAPEGTPVGASGAERATPSKLDPHQHALLLLNRLTFGPRPGDVARVEKEGFDKWFGEQLHPERIDDSAFQAELAKYPAARLSVSDAMKRFPPPNVLRQMANRGADLPSDPVERAIYADSLANYEAQQKKLAGTQAAPATAAPDPAMLAQNAVGATEDDPEARAFGMDANMPRPADTPAPAAKKAAALKHSRRVEPMDAAEVQDVLRLAPEDRYQRMLAMTPDESVAFHEGLKPAQRLLLTQGMTPAQTEVVLALQAPVRVVGAEAMETRLLRDVESNRQLEAVMTDFWLNHFSVYARKNQLEPYMLASYERETILPHALGRFEDLLVATAKSPAMLMYLDNWESIGDRSLAAERVKQVQAFRPDGAAAQRLPKGINENYGRELMELHTLGVNGGYSQKDVIEVAKCFTGWTVDRPYQGAFAPAAARPALARFGRFANLGQPQRQGKPGEFLFDPNRHEPGTKVVLGQEIKEDGYREGLAVLHLLATSPATARFLSQKLAVRFVSDNPPTAMVDRMTATWLKTDGDIRAVLSTMVHSPEFYTPAVYRAKVKTPLEFMVSALRASDATIVNPLPLVQAMDRLGMPVYGMQTPNGYSWKADEWVSSNALIARMNFSLVLAGGRLPGVRTNWPALLGQPAEAGVAASPTPETEARLEALLLGDPAAQKTRATVLAQFANPNVQQEALKNYNARPVTQSADATGEAGVPAMASQEMDLASGATLLRARATRRGAAGGGFDARAARPATPLDTMAGLLLGSPEFQRR